MVLLSALLSVICFLIGLVLSYYMGLPPGGSIVLSEFAVFLLLSLIGRILGR